MGSYWGGRSEVIGIAASELSPWMAPPGGRFRAVRGVSALEQVIDGARIVRNLSARTRVLFKMTVQRRNFREVPEVFRLGA